MLEDLLPCIVHPRRRRLCDIHARPDVPDRADAGDTRSSVCTAPGNRTPELRAQVTQLPVFPKPTMRGRGVGVLGRTGRPFAPPELRISCRLGWYQYSTHAGGSLSTWACPVFRYNLQLLDSRVYVMRVMLMYNSGGIICIQLSTRSSPC